MKLMMLGNFKAIGSSRRTSNPLAKSETISEGKNEHENFSCLHKSKEVVIDVLYHQGCKKARASGLLVSH